MSVRTQMICPDCKKFARILRDWCANECCWRTEICSECRADVTGRV